MSDSSKLGHRTKSTQELKTLYAEELAPKLRALEPKRLRARRIAISSLLPAVSIIGGYMLITSGSFPPELLFWVAIIASLGVAAWGYSVFSDYRAAFKRQVVERVVEHTFPALDFNTNSSVARSLYMKSGLFPREPDRYQGEDFAKGTIGDTDIEFSEIHSEYKTESTDSKGRRQTHWHTIFRGLFFHADFHKHTKSRTFVFPDVSEKNFGALVGGFLQKVGSSLSKHGELVRLENTAFEREFAVYAEDAQEARYVLTPRLMESMLALKNSFRCRMHFSFLDGEVFVAISTPKDLFEPRLFGSAIRFNDIAFFIQTVETVLSIVDELQLNIRIWTKQ